MLLSEPIHDESRGAAAATEGTASERSRVDLGSGSLFRRLCCFDPCVPFTSVTPPRPSELSASAGSKVVVVTANAWSGEQSYVSVVQTNVDLYRGIVPGLARLSPNAVMIVASQPGRVDGATRHAIKSHDNP